MLRLFKKSNLVHATRVLDEDESIIVSGTYPTIVMYTFFIKTASRRVLVYRRPEDYYYEQFRGLHSIGIGGRIEISDLIRDHVGDVLKMDTILDSGLREVEEEISYEGDRFGRSDVSYVGMIDDVTSALVCCIEVDESTEIRIQEPENIHVGWLGIDELMDLRGTLEPWSRDILDGFLMHYANLVSMESARTTWTKIPGYSRYEASTCGRIKNLRTGHISLGGRAGRYLKVSVYPDGSSTPRLEYLHILICRTFHGPGRPGQVVLHRNNMRYDCRAENLKWGSQSDNVQDAYDEGLVPNKGSNKETGT